MIKFILPILLFLGSLSASVIDYPFSVVDDDQYEITGFYCATYLDEIYIIFVRDKESNRLAVYVLSYFDKCLCPLNIKDLIRDYQKIPYEHVKDFKELKGISLEDYGL